MPEGFYSIEKIVGAYGDIVPFWKAEQYGWIKPTGAETPDWVERTDEYPIGHNLFVDNGRQMCAYALGFNSPITDYVISNFGVGTGTTPPTTADVSLQAPITLSTGTTLKPLNGIDFPAPYIARCSLTLGANDANGYLITELGLFSGNGTLVSRRVEVGINKSSSWSPTLLYRLRM